MSDVVFVYGALRSGTTLLRLMLDAHSRLACPGESDWLFDYLRVDGAGGSRYERTALEADRIFRAARIEFPERLEGAEAMRAMVCQLRREAPGPLVLMTHRNLGRILDLFPRAHILHLVRDPRDVARSAISMGWAGNVYYGLDPWLRTEAEWKCLAPRIMDGYSATLQYEDLVRDPRSALARVAAFFGEEFDPTMLNYHKASSYGPVDPALSQQWRNRLSASEIGLIETRVGALLEATGYVSSGHPAVHPSALHRLKLWLENKCGTWRMRVRRYGLAVPVLHALARRLRLGRAARQLRSRMDAKTIARLK